jgi:hypothetical protein
MEGINLKNTDYVLFDKENDTLARWSSDNEIVIYGDKEEAEEDCNSNEYVTRCTDLPKHHQEELIKQISKELKNK